MQVRQDIFDLSGQPLAVRGGLHSRIVRHVFRFAADKVVRFDIEEGA